jgi:hypothetical protein
VIGDAFAGITLKELIQGRREGLLTEEEFVEAKSRIFPGK